MSKVDYYERKDYKNNHEYSLRSNNTELDLHLNFIIPLLNSSVEKRLINKIYKSVRIICENVLFKKQISKIPKFVYSMDSMPNNGSYFILGTHDGIKNEIEVYHFDSNLNLELCRILVHEL